MPVRSTEVDCGTSTRIDTRSSRRAGLDAKPARKQHHHSKKPRSVNGTVKEPKLRSEHGPSPTQLRAVQVVLAMARRRGGQQHRQTRPDSS